MVTEKLVYEPNELDEVLNWAEQWKNIRFDEFNKIYSDSLIKLNSNQMNFFINAIQAVPSYSYFPAEKEVIEIRARENRLISKLKSVPTGKKNWHDYQEVCKEIFNFCLVPPLLEPFEELRTQDAIHRRDIVYPVSGGISGFWGFVQNTFSAMAVVVDAKNYKDELPKDQIVIVSKYFGTKKLVSRLGNILTKSFDFFQD